MQRQLHKKIFSKTFSMDKIKTTKTYLQAINSALLEEMEKDKKIIILGEDIGIYGGAFGVTQGLLERFGPERVIDTPISENSIVGVAIGSALAGLRPILEIMFMDFITLAMDQIVNHLTKFRYIYGGQTKLPVVIRTAAGGGKGYGPSHSQSLESWFMHVPGLKIAVPSNPHDAKWLLKTAINDFNPWLFIENKKLYAIEGEVGSKIGTPVGKANIVRSGRDCTVITYSRMTRECLSAIDAMGEKKFSIEVIDLRTLSPLDTETIYSSIRKTKCAIIVEEDCKTSGVGAEISARIMEKCFRVLSRPVLRLAGCDTPIPASIELEEAFFPNAGKIIKTIRKYLGKD